MKIETIELCGFKSFAERTVLEFPEGVTAIVGPNGCGKSNIVDALLWGLGEQSYKRLRGKQSEDVLFAGSQVEKQVGLAEVLITFGVNGDTLPAALRGYPKITVGRRIYRSGETEYTINRTPCRLKDINEIFLGSGLGSRSYSVIEQGRISQLVAARPEQRRVYIEEVAGVTRYRARRIEAERKMEATRQNLVHVSSILSELESQLRSLSRQAKKAERYQRFREEIHDLDARCTARELRILLAEQEGLQRRNQSSRSAAQTLRLAIDADELDRERRKLALAELERALQDRDAEIHELTVRVREAEQDGRYAAEEMERLDDRASHLVRERTSLEDLRAELEERREETESRRTEAVAAHERASGERRLREERLEGARTEQRRLEGLLESSKVAHFDAMNERSIAERDLESLERRTLGLGEARDRKLAERERLQLEVRSLEEGAQSSCTTLAGLTRRRESLDEERQLVRRKRAERKEELGELAGRLDDLRGTLARAESRHASLEELLRSRAGLAGGARALLERAVAEGRDAPTLVADVIDTEGRHAVAIEALLASELDHLLVDRLRDGVEPLSFLRSTSGGRVGMVPREGLRPPADPVTELDERIPGVVGRARDLVRARGGYEEMVRGLVAGAWIVEDLDRALELWSGGCPATLVTLDGEVLRPSGLLVGGGGDGQGPLATKDEIRRLSEESESLRGRVEEGSRDRDRLVAEMAQLEAREEELARELEAGEGERRETERSLGSTEEAVRRSKSTLEALEVELAEIDRERETAEADRITLQRRIDQAGARATELRAALDRGQDERSGAERTVEETNRAVLDATSREAARGEERRARDREVEELDSRLQDVRQRLGGLDGEQAAERDRRADAEQRASEAGRIQETEGARLRTLEEERTSARAEVDGLASELAELEAEIGRSRMRDQNLQDQLHEEERRLDVLGLRVQGLLERYRERYGKSLQPAEVPPPASARQIEDWMARLEELREKIRKMGEVNPGAVEEHRKVEERHTFFAEQKADLEKSLDDLTRAISNINRTTRRRFREAFDQVRGAFRDIFPRLFPGGEGDLRLTDGDLLEAGVEIMVRPGGKKIQGIELLSGGEKALSALAPPVRHPPREAVALLPARRGRRPARRGQRRPVQRDRPRAGGDVASDHDHPLDEVDGDGRPALRRDHGAPGRLPDRQRRAELISGGSSRSSRPPERPARLAGARS